MSTISDNSENLQERLYRLERERKEAGKSGNLREYALHLANENAVLRQILSAAAEPAGPIEIGVMKDETESIYGGARHLELDGS